MNRGAGNQIDLKIGVGVGVTLATLALILLIGLSYVVFKRHRRERLGTFDKPLDTPLITPEVKEKKAVVKTQKQLPPPPLSPVIEVRAESEDVPAESRGAGIYVLKPELEGTAGIPGAVGVYVREKSELEANQDGIVNLVLGPKPETRPATAPESPIVGLSFMYQQLGPP
ncbi:hypothetical protein ONZ43_g1159 [Nemania bipapillata]|uniref:Uncharacterized protein n=1 Tax=Nemania bipapillata TaxID=110536 RepID=A0ACC2J5W3_9PEZI|nr:hypothetical protein ONZ43_g1159 [Nemania bipapillata]